MIMRPTLRTALFLCEFRWPAKAAFNHLCYELCVMRKLCKGRGLRCRGLRLEADPLCIVENALTPVLPA